MLQKDKNRETLEKFQGYHRIEHDSCGIICIIEKSGTPSRKNLEETIRSLVQMEHRSGFIDGEGDGCGVLTDIPRVLWSQYLHQAGLDAKLAYAPQFAVAHIFVPRKGHDEEAVKAGIRSLIDQHGLTVAVERENQVNPSVLGKNGRQDEPTFWQIAILPKNDEAYGSAAAYASKLFELHVAIEAAYHVHVASLSPYSTAYKVMGAANILPQYFHDLASEDFGSSVTIGHNRYSTNTLSNFFRVQPFSILGHNGEINTISKLEEEAELLGVPLVDGGSDSQNLNRTIETFIHRYGLSLFEAMEVIFPPIHNEMKALSPDLQDMYVYLRQAWGHFAQGPAGIVSRYADECVFSVDSLGLRPLWMVESETSFYFSSEQGIIPVSQMASEPKPIAPGEKVGVVLRPDQGEVKVYDHHELQRVVLERFQEKVSFAGANKHLQFAYDVEATVAEPDYPTPTSGAYAAYGWDREQIQLVEQMASNGAEPIRSLGHDGPLAAISKERQNIADFIKESVAVVTNPAIDRDREMEHFSTRVILGARAPLAAKEESVKRIELPSPLLFEGQSLQQAAREQDTLSLEQVVLAFNDHPSSVTVLSLHFTEQEGIVGGLERLAKDAVKAVEGGTRLLVLDDSDTHREGRYWIDPHLAVSKVDRTLKQSFNAHGNLRRQCSIILRSGAVRSLHDLAVALGSGADAVSPYLMFATAFAKDGVASVVNLYSALNKGLEKVISTIGIHELRGYGRLFSSIGLRTEVADVLGIVNFCGSERAGTSFADLQADSIKRHADFHDEKAREAKTFHIFPRLWKLIGQIAAGEIPYADYRTKLEETEQTNPISIRHLADIAFDKAEKQVDPASVDLGVGDHSLPFIISSMSFGSQNETAFRAYAEAADQLNMISMNGEGGEIKDMLGKYPRTRGMQVASGRFGVNVELANSSYLLEIKIGQGAKPGEGGHLPGSKVTAKIAAARNATIGSDLISPSNNHDIYSIEDLAQMITELKTANHQAKVCVKVPVVPNIGTIAVGIAKAGADFITLSGFDGGTGAARVHALQHVGLPAEIGVKAAHNALLEAGLRDKVELWADGGVKSAADVAKLMMLGANRVGFGTLAMIAVGCTTCRGCHLDTCHVGIATQIDSLEEAQEKGLRRFVPRQFDLAVQGLKNFFTMFGEELRQITAALGLTRAQDLVGRSDLLVQTRCLEKMDLSALLAVHPLYTPEAVISPITREKQRVLVTAGAAAESSDDYFSADRPIQETFSGVLSGERVLGSRWSGARVKNHLDGSYTSLPEVTLTFTGGSVPGNGLAAYNAQGVNIRVQGGAQDGVGKTSFGGRVSILKEKGLNGVYINGSVGKSFCYGAQKGTFIVQGNADSRACIRLSGADVVFGGEITEPLRDDLGGIAARANIKGFAFEYMTNGRAVVLGDPGPWMCAGMTGGVVYVRMQPELGFDKEALRRRIAKGAKVSLLNLDEKGIADVRELLNAYKAELLATEQYETAGRIQKLIDDPAAHFIMISPTKEQADPSVSTE